MNSQPIYLDHNATTPILPEVVEAMLPFLREHFGNPSSNHVYGQRARAAVERAREEVASLIGSHADEIIFTSGGTEANNMAIRGVAELADANSNTVTSIIEHPAILNTCAWLEKQGRTVTRIGVDYDGRVNMTALRTALSTKTALVTIMHSNNETGVLQPIAEVVKAAHAVGALTHTDAAQSVGKVRIAVDELDIDLLSLVGHKMYAPKGVGALYVRRGTKLAPFMLGAGHECGMRAGTENVASVVGLGAACDIALRDLDSTSARLSSLRDRLWTLLREQVPMIAMNGHAAERLPNTLNVRFPGVVASALLAAAPGIAASAGSACHEGRESPSEVLLAMGLTPENALGSIRLSLGRATTQTEIEFAAKELARAWSTLSKNSNGPKSLFTALEPTVSP
jgi:cysteine desulfurase